MNFKNIRIKYLLPSLIIAFAYPIAKAIRSEKTMLVFSDACTLLGLAFIVVGIVNSLFLHGDFDISGYVANRAMKNKKDFDVYMEEQEEKRKESFNYPLFSGILLLIAAYLSSLLV